MLTCTSHCGLAIYRVGKQHRIDCLICAVQAYCLMHFLYLKLSSWHLSILELVFFMDTLLLFFVIGVWHQLMKIVGDLLLIERVKVQSTFTFALEFFIWHLGRHTRRFSYNLHHSINRWWSSWSKEPMMMSLLCFCKAPRTEHLRLEKGLLRCLTEQVILWALHSVYDDLVIAAYKHFMFR